MTYKKWTNTDKEFIKNNCFNMSDDELALRLSQLNNSEISVAMVRTQRRKLGIQKKRGRFSKATKDSGVTTSIGETPISSTVNDSLLN
jgi:hypothetical protein